MTSEEPVHVVKEPTVFTAVVPLVLLILLIFGSLLIFGLDALDGPIQVALLLSCMCAALVALWLGYRWSEVQEVGRVAMGTITSAIFILLAVGALIGPGTCLGQSRPWCSRGSRCCRRVGTTWPAHLSAV